MSDSAVPVLSLQHIVKQFGATRALEDASLHVRPGSVHGLVGENGAGKSTLIKILAGIHSADAGTIVFNGKAIARLEPAMVEALGIHFIHQDRLLPPSLTVGEALFLGREPTRFGLVRRRYMARMAEQYLRDYFDISLSGMALISELSTAEQQIVQITRALLANPAVLVFDEPTAALVRREVDQLQRIILRLKQQGLAVIYISHYLQEIEALCDEVTILRNGRDVGTVDPALVPAAQIARLMINRDVTEMYPKVPVIPGEVVLEVERLSLASRLNHVSFSLRRGEILGMTGLVGSGVKAVVEALFGLAKPEGGSIRLHGKALRIHSPAAAVAAGVALVPEDRRRHGIATELSVAENIALPNLKRFSRGGCLSARHERGEVDRLIVQLRIKTSGREAWLRQLSGGNQQKVAIAKWLARDSAVYLFDEPAVGVDVGAKVEIYRLIGELVSQGAAVIIVSSDLQELSALSDRVAVFYRGEIVRTFDASEADSDRILAAATGAGAPEAAQAFPHSETGVHDYVSA